MPKVLNKRTDKIPPDAVYVGRPTTWGNPMTVREVRSLNPGLTEFEANQIAVNWYRQYIKLRPDLIEAARRELRDKDLVCWCAPLPCHADILLELANQP